MLQIKHFVFSPIAENTYVLYNEKAQACIIDPGCYYNYEEKQLHDFIENQHLQVLWLLNTHTHLDHVFGLRYAAATWGLTPHLHPNEKQVLERAPAAAAMYNLPFPAYQGPLSWLAESQEINLGEDKLKVLYTPGHSPGHVCFYCEAQHFVIGGDVLFRRSIGRTDLPGANFETLVESIRNQLYTLPPETVVYSGHGPTTTIGEEMAENPFVHGQH